MRFQQWPKLLWDFVFLLLFSFRYPRLIKAVLTPLIALRVFVEPIISAGGETVRTMDDDWTIATSDGSLAAHFEHTIVVTRDRPFMVTAA